MTSVSQGLVFSHITHLYGHRPILRDLCLSVEPGEVVCILGPSGCGKTTTLRLAAGLEHPQQGTVSLNGQVVSGPGIHLPPERRNIGFLFQDFALFPHLSVADNVAFGLGKIRADQRTGRVRQMLRQVGMEAYETAWPHQLSGGQQQRVALARALAPHPGLMLLDEPFSGLDKRLRDQIRDETLHVLKSSDVSALMVTHDPEEAMFMADRIAIMRDGQLVQMGPPQQLYQQPCDGFVASFFGEINSLPARVQGGLAMCAAGDFATALPDCQSAEVFIRPEGIRLLPDDRTGPARLLSCRALGRHTLAHLQVLRDGFAPCHLHARLPGEQCWQPGQAARLEIDPQQTHIFPASPG